MNKRQVKKRKKIIKERIQFFNRHVLISGRRNGKSTIYKKMLVACYGKHYKPFKSLKKIYNKVFLAVDLSNSKDYSAEIEYKINKGEFKIIKTTILKNE